MILSTSFSHQSGRPRHRLPSGDQVIIHLRYLLSSMHTERTFHFNMLFLSLPNIVCVPPPTQFFPLITPFLNFSSLEVLAACSDLKKAVLRLTLSLEIITQCLSLLLLLP